MGREDQLQVLQLGLQQKIISVRAEFSFGFKCQGVSGDVENKKSKKKKGGFKIDKKGENDDF